MSLRDSEYYCKLESAIANCSQEVSGSEISLCPALSSPVLSDRLAQHSNKYITTILTHQFHLEFSHTSCHILYSLNMVAPQCCGRFDCCDPCVTPSTSVLAGCFRPLARLNAVLNIPNDCRQVTLRQTALVPGKESVPKIFQSGLRTFEA